MSPIPPEEEVLVVVCSYVVAMVIYRISPPNSGKGKGQTVFPVQMMITCCKDRNKEENKLIS
jgi:hypothetical protein